MSLKFPRTWDFGLKMDMSRIVRSHSMMAVEEKVPSGPWGQLPNSLECPLKTGWLKKQRSIVKNWQQRYFVLKGQHLYYYKEEEDMKPQGMLKLKGSVIKEVAPSGSDEVGRFIFEIIPGLSGDQSRTGQDSFVLMANSQANMEEWVKLLRRAVGSPPLGVVFGQQLGDTMLYEQRFGPHQVPILMEKCTEFIRKNGLEEEGIFRLPGQDNLVKKLRDAFDAGERPSFDQDTDVHTVASLFKLYLRELPEPVIPWSQYEDFLLCGQLLTADEPKGHSQLAKQLTHLPQDNYNLLSYICRFLHEIQQSSATNKMCVENLATVFGVNLLRPTLEDPVTIMRGTPQIQKVMTAMISDHEKLFPVSKDTLPSPPPQESNSKKAPVLRSSVGWDAIQRPPMSWRDKRSLLQIKDGLEASSSELSDGSDPSAEEKGKPPSEDVLGAWAVRKRTQTLPNRKCMEAVSSKRWIESSDRAFAFSSIWSLSSSPAGRSSPGSSSGGHKRTLSQGISQLLHLHRASDSNNACGSVPDVRSQCGKITTGQPSDDLGTGLQTSDPPTLGQNGASVRNLPAEEDSSYPEDPELLRKMIVELKEEMMTQKSSYEEQIQRLEKENNEVWAKVVKLNKEIEEEKTKSAELESKLQNRQSSREEEEEGRNAKPLKIC